MSSSRWRERDRVFAPWEPDFLYPATVRFIGKHGVMIEFDDGDEGLVPEEELRPIHLQVGGKVQARRVRGEKMYEWAEIVEVRGERLRIRYDEDDFEEELDVQYVRVPHPSILHMVQPDAELASLWKEGDRVLAPWEPFFMYPATIERIESGMAVVEYDDGDAGPVPLAELQPIDIEQGALVQARRVKFEKIYEPATIADVDGEVVTVRYAVDSYEEDMDIAYIRIPRPVPGMPHG